MRPKEKTPVATPFSHKALTKRYFLCIVVLAVAFKASVLFNLSMQSSLPPPNDEPNVQKRSALGSVLKPVQQSAHGPANRSAVGPLHQSASESANRSALGSVLKPVQQSAHESEPCALLFFGLAKEFKSTILPSIQKQIIQHNQHCDIFLHTYNITEVPRNVRNGETGSSRMNVAEAYLLVTNNNAIDVDVDDHIIIESIDSFYNKRGQDLNRTRKNFHKIFWGECCVSHDNMIKQWHSIEGAWDLMRAHEKKMLLPLHDNATSGSIHTNATYYKHVGIFRSDVFYITPIKVNDAVAVIPSFHSNFGYCDRLFIGEYKYARIWASKRFDFIPIFENQYMDIKNGYHSETLLKNMLNHYKVPVVKEQICFMRVRAGPRIMKGDCGEYPEFKTLEQRNKILSQHVDSASSTITIKDISTITTSTTKSKTATTTINDSSSLSSEDDVDDDNDDAPCVDKTGTFKVKGISGNKLTCKKVKKKNKCNEKGENGKKLSELCPIRCKTFCDDDDNDNDNTALGDNTASEESNNNVATINSRERLLV